MNINNYLLISSLVVSIDAIYLKMVSNYFGLQIKKIQGTQLQLSILPTILCYLLITLGIYFFMVEKKFSLTDMFVLGVFTYGIYELTNKALFDQWMWKTVLIDGIWGGILFSLVHYIYHLI